MTYWHPFDASVPGGKRVDQVIEWLALPDEQRPHLITLYFEDVDTVTHRYGPGSAESIDAIRRVDVYLALLRAGIDALPIADDVYLVIVSDHGQAPRSNEHPFIMESVIDLDGLTVVDHGAAAFLYLPNPDVKRAGRIRDSINDAWQHGKALLRDELPASWRATEEAGFADVVVQADLGYLVYSSARFVDGASRGDHGWAREHEEMHGIFLASGPRLPGGRRVGPIEAVDIYPLMMEILGLPITKPIDGNPDKLVQLLN
jgi:arylsulfatase A-like enzyme